jgi:hypothetical protein
MKELIKRLTGNRKLKYLFILLSVVIILVVMDVYKKRGNWVELEKKDFMNGVSYYEKDIGKNTMNNNPQVRVKTVYTGEGRVFFINMFSSYISQGTENELEGFSYVINTDEIKCIEKEYKIISTTLYDEKDKVLYTKTNEQEDWKPIPPKTELEELSKDICK